MGTNFTTVTSVMVGGTSPATIGTHTGTQITVTAPAKSAGSYPVVVKTPVGGTSTNTHNLTYVGTPAITSITPISGKATATHSLTITGTNFTTVTSVTVGGTAATIGAHTATQITVTAPAKTNGSYAVVIRTPVGGSSTSAHSFRYQLTAPTVSKVTPSEGKTTGGLHVKITGTSFTTVTAVTGVKFGTTNATSFTRTSATQITAVDPAGAAGPVEVTVDHQVRHRGQDSRLHLRRAADGDGRHTGQGTGGRRHHGQDHRDQLHNSDRGDSRDNDGDLLHQDQHPDHSGRPRRCRRSGQGDGRPPGAAPAGTQRPTPMSRPRR